MLGDFRFFCYNINSLINPKSRLLLKGIIFMEDHIILGVHITERAKHVPEVQKLFSKYAANIKTRLGLHEVSKDFCSPNGLIILELIGNPKQCDKLAKELAGIEGIETKMMKFPHD